MGRNGAEHDDEARVDLVEWGDRLRKRRLRQGLRQVELAKAVSVDQAKVSRWEQGHSRPSDEQRIALARALSTTVGRLFPYPTDVR